MATATAAAGYRYFRFGEKEGDSADASKGKEDVWLRSARTRSYLKTVFVLFVSTTTIAVLVAFYLVVTLPKKVGSRIHHDDRMWTGCGQSQAEAIAHGCKFDVMMSSWVPSSCFNEEDVNLFATNGITFYADVHATQTVSLDEVKKAEYTRLYTSIQYHFNHCSYLWHKQIRALVDKAPVDSDSYDVEHVSHCYKTMLSNLHGEADKGPTQVEIKPGFIACGTYTGKH